MEKKIFAVPSTSTPAERAFSCGRLLIHHTRGSMLASTIRARMCSRNRLLHDYCLKSLASVICTALADLISSFLEKHGLFLFAVLPYFINEG